MESEDAVNLREASFQVHPVQVSLRSTLQPPLSSTLHSLHLHALPNSLHKHPPKSRSLPHRLWTLQSEWPPHQQLNQTSSITTGQLTQNLHSKQPTPLHPVSQQTLRKYAWSQKWRETGVQRVVREDHNELSEEVEDWPWEGCSGDGRAVEDGSAVEGHD